MTLTTTFRVGALTCHTIEGGAFRLDGGGMFGVVPKVLWERRIAADDKNRIPLAMRCLLVEHPGGLVLVDTALGNKEPARFLEHHAVENTGHRGATQLEDGLAELGFQPDDVKYVINTHLHFDHAGGNTRKEGQPGHDGQESGTPSARSPVRPSAVPSFPNATYIVQRGDLDFARHANERTIGSYFAHNYEPIDHAGLWQLVDGESEPLPGIRLLPTPGHVPFHQSIVIADRGETACFLADLVPTAAHLSLPWIMGYDVEPLRTLETKRSLLRQAHAEGWMLVFEHDAARPLGRVVQDDKGYGYAPLDTSEGAK